MLCFGAEEQGKRRRIVIASNDRDLQQLLDDSTVVLQMLPWHRTKGWPFCHVTAASFQSAHGFSPKAFPVHLALSGLLLYEQEQTCLYFKSERLEVCGCVDLKLEVSERLAQVLQDCCWRKSIP